MDWLTFVVVDPVKAMFIRVWGYIPAIAGAIVILVIGWLVAKLIETVIVRVLKAIRLDAASDKAGVSNVLAQGEIRLTVSELIGAVVYWIIILVVIATALGTLSLTVAADMVQRLIEYVPNILGAIFILIVGSFVADFVSTIVRTTAGNAGLKKASMLAKLTKTVLVIFAVVIAIEQLKIASTLIVLAVNIVLISVGIGIALAFGLGCKDIAGKFVQDVINDMKK
ncbi:MAG: hypothetical protein PHS46_05390 [Candidatus Omnitrophica bacterium]|jgi:hypothetical protein|nr:hypothetical protein [Candidatus Omnitrophota bacterium]